MAKSSVSRALNDHPDVSEDPDAGRRVRAFAEAY